jgi:3-oxoacyl-[acyl-carrier protein] reductase
MILEGKVAVVTGASRGIGRAIALCLAGHGADVAVNYASRRDAAEDVARAVRELGRRAQAVQADVRDADAVRRMARHVGETLGPADILVNNAGVLRDKPVTFMTDDEWDDAVDVSLKGSFHAIKAFGRDMVRRKTGKIVNMASDAGLLGDVMRAGYASAKAGLLGLTRTVAREFAASGVCVNAISPGLIDTDMTAGMEPTRRAKLTARIPLGRFGTPEEVARLALFLASPDSDYLTGAVICVDGGLYM